MWRKNRLSGEKCVPTPGLQGGGVKILDERLVHACICRYDQIIFLTYRGFLIDDMGIWVSKWILSREIVPYDI